MSLLSHPLVGSRAPGALLLESVSMGVLVIKLDTCECHMCTHKFLDQESE